MILLLFGYAVLKSFFFFSHLLRLLPYLCPLLPAPWHCYPKGLAPATGDVEYLNRGSCACTEGAAELDYQHLGINAHPTRQKPNNVLQELGMDE